MLPRLYAILDADVCHARGVTVGAVARELAGAGVRLVQWRNKGGSPAEVLAGAAEIRVAFAEVGGCLLVINDRVDLALLAGFGGVHVGQGDLGVEEVREALLRVESGPTHREGGDEWGTRGVGGSGAEMGPTHRLKQGRDEWGTQIVDTQTLDAQITDVQIADTRTVASQGVGGFVVGVSTHTEEEVRAAELTSADYVAMGPVFATGTKADAAAVVGLAGVRMARRWTTKPLVAIGGITLANSASVVEAGADSVAVISGLMVEGRSVGEVAGSFIRALES